MPGTNMKRETNYQYLMAEALEKKEGVDSKNRLPRSSRPSDFNSQPLYLNNKMPEATNKNINEYIRNDNLDPEIKEKIINYSKSVGYISVDGVKLGTGFLVHPQVIVTSKHVLMDSLIDKKGDLGAFKFVLPSISRDAGAEESNQPDEISISCCLEDGCPEDEYPNLDYLVLRLENEVIGRDPLNLIGVSSEFTGGSSVWTLHFPDDDKEQKISVGWSEDNQFKQLLASSNLDTVPGSSGSPLIDANGNVFGIHRSSINEHGYRSGILLEQIYSQNTSEKSILENIGSLLSGDGVTLSYFIPVFSPGETLEGFKFHSNNPAELQSDNRAKSIHRYDSSARTNKFKKQQMDRDKGKDLKKHVKEEYKSAFPKVAEPDCDVDLVNKAHRISAKDIRSNIATFLNTNRYKQLISFAKLIHQVALGKKEIDKEFEESRKLINNMFTYQSNGLKSRSSGASNATQMVEWVSRTNAAEDLYENMYHAKYNVSFAHSITNGAIGECLDLNFNYNSTRTKKSLTPRSRRIIYSHIYSHMFFNFSLPKVTPDEDAVYSSHIIDPKGLSHVQTNSIMQPISIKFEDMVQKDARELKKILKLK